MAEIVIAEHVYGMILCSGSQLCVDSQSWQASAGALIVDECLQLGDEISDFHRTSKWQQKPFRRKRWSRRRLQRWMRLFHQPPSA